MNAVATNEKASAARRLKVSKRSSKAIDRQSIKRCVWTQSVHRLVLPLRRAASNAGYTTGYFSPSFLLRSAVTCAS